MGLSKLEKLKKLKLDFSWNENFGFYTHNFEILGRFLFRLNNLKELHLILRGVSFQENEVNSKNLSYAFSGLVNLKTFHLDLSYNELGKNENILRHLMESFKEMKDIDNFHLELANN